jgi:hypothetical protein
MISLAGSGRRRHRPVCETTVARRQSLMGVEYTPRVSGRRAYERVSRALVCAAGLPAAIRSSNASSTPWLLPRRPIGLDLASLSPSICAVESGPEGFASTHNPSRGGSNPPRPIGKVPLARKLPPISSLAVHCARLRWCLRQPFNEEYWPQRSPRLSGAGQLNRRRLSGRQGCCRASRGCRSREAVPWAAAASGSRPPRQVA